MKSAIITAYREPGFVEENIKFFRNKGYEVIVAADEPNDELASIIDKYGVKASVSEKRRGKWLALNDAAKLAEGEVLFFVDSDTKVWELSGIDGCDVVELRKEVKGSSLLEKLVNIDYFMMYLVSKLAAKLKTCIGINGSAFLIKRSVFNAVGGFRRKINEDTDLGVRLGLAGFKYGLFGKAITKAPDNWKSWLSQRERWSAGGAEILMENFREIITKPKLWLPYVILFYPAIVGMILSMLLPDNIVIKFFYLLLPLLVFISPKLASIVIMAIYEINAVRNLLILLASFVAWAVVMIALSKKFDYEIEAKVLPIYYFFYSPLWTFVSIITFAKVLVYKRLGKEIKLDDWKV